MYTVHFESHRPNSGTLMRHYIFEGFEVTGGDEICIRIYGADITIRDTLVHHCSDHGILGTDNDSGNITLEYVEIHSTGGHPPGENLKHPIYIATDSTRYPDATLRISHCYLHHNNGGEGIKSRSRRNEIYYNWVQGAPGSVNYYQMSLYGPEDPVVPGIREDGDVVGNVFVASTFGSNVRLGSDGHSNSEGRYRFVNNTFVSFASSPRDFIRVFETIESIELVNNVFYSLNGTPSLVNLSDAAWTHGETITGGNNWIGQNVRDIAPALTSSVRGTSPGLQNMVSYLTFDPRPLQSSSVINQGTIQTLGSNSYPIPSPLLFPVELPPIRFSADFQAHTAIPRVTSGTLPDIGAFELGGLTDQVPPSAPTNFR